MQVPMSHTLRVCSGQGFLDHTSFVVLLILCLYRDYLDSKDADRKDYTAELLKTCR